MVPGGFCPPVAVLIPAYNEEKVIVRTIRSVLNSDYPNLRVIVIDDGSKDRTFEVARKPIPMRSPPGPLDGAAEGKCGQGGGAELRHQQLQEARFYVGIDADTVIAPDAVSLLITRFADPRVGAVAGNARVGNRLNLWTRWQALEYITSQNFERRALEPIQCGDRGSRGASARGARGRPAEAAAIPSIPSPKMPT